MNNQVNFVGYVGQDPRQLSFGEKTLVKFTLAVKEYSSNTDEDKTLWLDIDAWSGLGERVLQYVTQGREIAISGRLTINQYRKDIDGIVHEVYKPVVKLSSFHLCGSRPKAEEEVVAEEKPARRRKLAAVRG